MRLRLGRIFICAAVLLVTGSGCSKTNNVDQSKDTTNNLYTKKIGQNGGKVGDVTALGAFIPVGAVDGEEQISIRPAEPDEYPDLPAGTAGEVYSFDPTASFSTRRSMFTCPRLRAT